MASATVRLIGDPTLVIEAGGLRLLTGPTSDQPGPFDVVLLCDQAARAAAILASPTVVPAHVEGWDRYTECIDEVRAAFARPGLSDQSRVLAAGDTATV
ncbi:MAG TPA: hypothetical protein VFO16_23555 [Pseudonocardiaceae bacterium]|nr:hypothetical protein [Pseudonocardiaceae bacterium]